MVVGQVGDWLIKMGDPVYIRNAVSDALILLSSVLMLPSHLLTTQEYPQGTFTQSDRPVCLVGLCSASHPVIHTFFETPRSTFLGFRGVHEQVCCTFEWTDGESYKEDNETVVRYVVLFHPPFPPTVIQVYSQITLTIMVNLVLP